MNSQIAIPLQNDQLCSHFGHCEFFYIAEIQDGKILNEKRLTPPQHEPGVYPKWLAGMGVTNVIVGNIGAKAKELFAKAQVGIYGSNEHSDPRLLVQAFLKGELRRFEGSCNHNHEDNCNH